MKEILQKSRLQRSYMSVAVQARFVSLFLCLRRNGITLPRDLVELLVRHLTAWDDFVIRSSFEEEPPSYGSQAGRFAVETFDAKDTYVFRWRLVCDGEQEIRYSNAETKNCLLYWKRLRDGSDFSWKTTQVSSETPFKIALLGDLFAEVVPGNLFIRMMTMICRPKKA